MSDTIRGLPENLRLPHETRNFGITPFFKHLAPLNEAKSEELGQAVYEPIMEVVELQLAGDRNYSPVVPAASMARREGNRVITFAELYADQYRAFVMGGDQIAGGTALEELQRYGISPAQLSVCRALKIYSIEALHGLDGPALKGLGMSANELKSMARRFMEDRQTSAHVTDGVKDLEAEVSRLRALIEAQKGAEQIDEIVAKADAEVATDKYGAMSDEQLKEYIREKVGSRPRGNPSRETLLAMARDL